MKDLIFALLGKTYNLPPERIAEILFKKAEDGTLTDEPNENALSQLLELDATRVKTIRDDKSGFDNGHKKGMKDALEKLERDIKERYNLPDSTATGIDLINEIAAQSAKVALDDDKVKLHPAYLNLEKKASETERSIREEYEAKINDITTQQARKERFASVVEKINAEFDALRPVLPTNPAAAATQRKAFMDLFGSFDYEIQPDGTVIIINEDGKRVETAHGHPVSIQDLVKTKASERFDFAAQDPKGNSGAGTGTQGGGSTPPNPDFVVPKDANDARARLFSAKTPEERAPLYEYLKQVEGGSN